MVLPFFRNPFLERCPKKLGEVGAFLLDELQASSRNRAIVWAPETHYDVPVLHCGLCVIAGLGNSASLRRAMGQNGPGLFRCPACAACPSEFDSSDDGNGHASTGVTRFWRGVA